MSIYIIVSFNFGPKLKLKILGPIQLLGQNRYRRSYLSICAKTPFVHRFSVNSSQTMEEVAIHHDRKPHLGVFWGPNLKIGIRGTN